MYSASNNIVNTIVSPVRKIEAKVELYNGSTLIQEFFYTDVLKSIDIERVGESGKFFGFGICQKANIKLIDKNRELAITTANSFRVYFGANNEYVSTFPIFYVTEVHRDENTNELSITAYDLLNEASKLSVNEANEHQMTIANFIRQAAMALGLTSSDAVFNNCPSNVLNRFYPKGGNFEGTESLRSGLDAAAEALQAIYYINPFNEISFKVLDKNGVAQFTIGKDKYFTLKSKDNRRLATICHATELGDNISATLAVSGTTQYVRNNPFWELEDDIGDIVNNALSTIGGITINQFECSWRGNFLLAIGDKIELITKDDGSVISYVLNDTISYNGSLSEKTSWSYEETAETSSNPSTLGDALKQTYARVDKVNKQIELVASESNANKEAISSLQINTDGISATVSELESSTSTALEGVNENIAELHTKIEQTATEVTISINEVKNTKIDEVTTTTGFTFNDEGLTVEKSNREMKTQITEDGMTVYKNNKAVLTANNKGVDAANLHATTYLIIGKNSRFEDFGSKRTGCFWIGG